VLIRRYLVILKASKQDQISNNLLQIFTDQGAIVSRAKVEEVPHVKVEAIK
jgi:hypothetical protein